MVCVSILDCSAFLFFSSRDPECRRKARVAFVCATEILGPHYFAWCINFISTSLTKGYRVSVLHFTAAAALTQLVLGHGAIGNAAKQSVKIPCGSIDDVISLLLPLIGQELDRLCDPNRPEYEAVFDAAGAAVKRPGVDEQRYFRSGDVVSLLCRVSSFDAICNQILKYLHGLLTGTSSQEILRSSNVAAVFSKKYRNIVLQLFEEVS